MAKRILVEEDVFDEFQERAREGESPTDTLRRLLASPSEEADSPHKFTLDDWRDAVRKK